MITKRGATHPYKRQVHHGSGQIQIQFRVLQPTPSSPVNRARCSWASSSLRCPSTKSTHGTRWSRAKWRIPVLNRSLIVPSGAVEAIGSAS
jgi:hypothetical protein